MSWDSIFGSIKDGLEATTDWALTTVQKVSDTYTKVTGDSIANVNTPAVNYNNEVASQSFFSASNAPLLIVGAIALGALIYVVAK